MRLSRRIRPALVVNSALATSLLAVVATGDTVSLPARPQAVERPADEAVGGGDAGDSGDSAPGAQAGGATSPNSIPTAPLPDALLAQSLAPLDAAAPTRLSVAVSATDGSVTAVYGEEHFDTASIVKVDILAALLLQAQDAGRELTTQERGAAEVMIQQSDNDAADELWNVIGRGPGLNDANERLGLTGTTAGPEGHWGLTQTTSLDQIALLRAVYGTSSPLDASSRTYIRDLMATVVPDQRWGISAAVYGAAGVELKNGWLPRTKTGLWDVNSIGRILVAGREYLVAVVSDGHASHAEGIEMVEAAAAAAITALLPVSEGSASSPGA
ncbi:serine hydrolase [Streptomyces sp. SBT349]|uniref:serine hydrolase n=1 Tax=Streptomyces sp. SBT349 TaxID=1580539 RepID=UPI00066C3541|nr:serine hydrolase [Streptomyces sp. SBT349]